MAIKSNFSAYFKKIPLFFAASLKILLSLLTRLDLSPGHSTYSVSWLIKIGKSGLFLFINISESEALLEL